VCALASPPLVRIQPAYAFDSLHGEQNQLRTCPKKLAGQADNVAIRSQSAPEASYIPFTIRFILIKLVHALSCRPAAAFASLLLVLTLCCLLQ
jgi:hypothetical protein